MKYTSVRLVLAALLLVTIISFASAQDPTQVYQVDVSVAYLNTLTGKPVGGIQTPIPFASHGNNILVGVPSVLEGSEVISDSVDAPHDTGVIKFANKGALPVDIDLDSICVVISNTTNSSCYAPPIDGVTGPTWAQRNGNPVYTLQPGNTLVLAETENYNFDTSDLGLGQNPHVVGKIYPLPVGSPGFDIEDSDRVLFGMEERKNTAESTGYEKIGSVIMPPPAEADLESPRGDPGICMQAYPAQAFINVTNYGGASQSFKVDESFELDKTPPQPGVRIVQGDTDTNTYTINTLDVSRFAFKLKTNSDLNSDMPIATSAKLLLNFVDAQGQNTGKSVPFSVDCTP